MLHHNKYLPRTIVLCIIFTLTTAVLSPAQTNTASSPEKNTRANPKLVQVRKIWDKGGHNAFTDLIRFKGQWFCTFREADRHAGGTDGKIRVIVSPDAGKWRSAALLAEKGVDLRDPKISLTPDNRLMLLMGGSRYKGRKLLGRQGRVSFSTDGYKWTPPQPILQEGDWLWRVTWHKGRAYGVSYHPRKKWAGESWQLTLFTSLDGTHFTPITALQLPEGANETTLRFLPDDTMVAFVRLDGKDIHARIGTARPPYKTWNWYETKLRVGGPNFIVLPDGKMWAAGRFYPGGAKTVLARFGTRQYEPVLTLPSGGDTSYPGMVWFDGYLWMSYYSSHEGKTSIYLAKIKLPE